MMCNIASPAMASKVLKASNTVNLLTDISSNMRQHTQTLSDIVLQCNKHMDIHAHPTLDSVLKMDVMFF
jgi:hypothetical protein